MLLAPSSAESSARLRTMQALAAEPPVMLFSSFATHERQSEDSHPEEEDVYLPEEKVLERLDDVNGAFWILFSMNFL